MTNNNINLTEEQKVVIEAFRDSVLNGTEGFIIALIGNAGCGKTTILSQLKNIAQFCAPTNKAARVLNGKGCKATSFASAMFKLDGDKDNPRDPERGWSPVKEVVLVVDEASMLDSHSLDCLEYMAANYGWKVLLVGDNFQLPPVGLKKGDKQFFERGYKTYRLTRVFRQFGGSEILTLATALRKSAKLITPIASKGEVEIVNKATALKQYVEDLKNNIDCTAVMWRNIDRVNTNIWIRKKLGYTEPIVCKEHLLSIANATSGNDEDYLYLKNGEDIVMTDQVKITDARKISISTGWKTLGEKIQEDAVFFETVHNDKIVKNVLLPKTQAATVYHRNIDITTVPEEYTTWVQKRRRYVQVFRPDVNIFTYGYAITAHKSQGGQWEKVYLLQNSTIAGDAQRWLYTAVTRASKKLVISDSLSGQSIDWSVIEKLCGDTATVKTPKENKEEVDAICSNEYFAKKISKLTAEQIATLAGRVIATAKVAKEKFPNDTADDSEFVNWILQHSKQDVADNAALVLEAAKLFEIRI